MTKAEWLVCTEPTAMLELLRGTVSDRKLWLFGSACCRRIWPLLLQVSKDTVEAGEAYADGLIPHADLMDASIRNHRQADASESELAIQAAVATNASVVDPSRNGYPALAVAQTARTCADKVVLVLDLAGDATGVMEAASNVEVAGGERRAQADLLRDIVGNPFRSAVVEPGWRTPAVLDCARAIYDNRVFDRLPILGEALEDAGCGEAEILSHCRGDGPHVRGCWVIDLLLGNG